jgi:hydrogenase maturation protease
MSEGKVLMIGWGNPARGDDAVGIRLIEQLRMQSWPEHVALMLHKGDSLALLEYFADVTTLFLCDAVVSDQPPGTLVTIDLQQSTIPDSPAPCSSHGLSLKEVIEMAGVLGLLPETSFFVGIVVDQFETGAELSKDVQASLKDAAHFIEQQLQLTTQEERHA